ncbi:hypothetical protein PROFUN_11513 [Planoprotostelium fungivorum]|uniref:Uncharacterized protein n=1 Tax=Planoprotostelium fungivorum TaxID=1890364 RepID=A0A2P6N9Z8_9EUKA|nr:hypothetical protein PROFUN_11513 [Planoprotostelium fungivorum]
MSSGSKFRNSEPSALSHTSTPPPLLYVEMLSWQHVLGHPAANQAFVV